MDHLKSDRVECPSSDCRLSTKSVRVFREQGEIREKTETTEVSRDMHSVKVQQVTSAS